MTTGNLVVIAVLEDSVFFRHPSTSQIEINLNFKKSCNFNILKFYFQYSRGDTKLNATKTESKSLHRYNTISLD